MSLGVVCDPKSGARHLHSIVQVPPSTSPSRPTTEFDRRRCRSVLRPSLHVPPRHLGIGRMRGFSYSAPTVCPPPGHRLAAVPCPDQPLHRPIRNLAATTATPPVVRKWLHRNPIRTRPRPDRALPCPRFRKRGPDAQRGRTGRRRRHGSRPPGGHHHHVRRRLPYVGSRAHSGALCGESHGGIPLTNPISCA